VDITSNNAYNTSKNCLLIIKVTINRDNTIIPRRGIEIERERERERESWFQLMVGSVNLTFVGDPLLCCISVYMYIIYNAHAHTHPPSQTNTVLETKRHRNYV